MASETPRWTVETASALLRTLLQEGSEQGIDRGLRERHLRPRSVLAQFELEKGGEAQKALREDLVMLAPHPGEPQWYTLKPPSRMEGLRLLGNVEAMRAARRETGSDRTRHASAGAGRIPGGQLRGCGERRCAARGSGATGGGVACATRRGRLHGGGSPRGWPFAAFCTRWSGSPAASWAGRPNSRGCAPSSACWNPRPGWRPCALPLLLPRDAQSVDAARHWRHGQIHVTGGVHPAAR